MKRISFTSLRVRLMLLVLIATIPALGITLYSGLEQREDERQHALDGALRLAQDISETHDRLISNARQILFALSKISQIQQQDKAACSKIFADITKQSEGYTALVAAKPNGDMFASSIPVTRPINYSDRPWFQRLLKTRDFVIGEYLIGRVTGKPLIVLAHPVLDDRGNLKAVLSLGMDLDWLKQTLVKSKLPEGTSVSVTDSGGTILFRFPEPENFLGKSMPEVPILKAILEKREGVEETVGLGGLPRLFGFTSLVKGIESVHVGVGTPKKVALAKAEEVLKENLGYLGLIALLALVVAWFMGGFFIMHPVNRLLDATKQLANGDLTVRAGLSSRKGEIGQLADAFDQMAESLQLRQAERKRAEEALRKSEERYRNILDNLQDGYFELDIAGNLTFFNDSLCQILQYSKEELTGMNNRNYMDKETAKMVYQTFNRVYTTGEPLKAFEYKIIKKDGTERFIESPISLITDAEGKPIGFRGIGRDITERKRTEEVLRRSEEEAKRLAQENGIVAEIGRIIGSTLNIEEVYEPFTEEARKLIPFDGISVNVIDHEKGTIKFSYISGIEVKGRMRGDSLPLAGTVSGRVVQTRSGVIVEVDDSSKAKENYPFLLEDYEAGFRSFMTVPLISKDQAVGTILFRSAQSGIYSDRYLSVAERIASQIAGAIANTQLFSERNQAEEALRKSEERFRELFDNAPVGYQEHDTEGLIHNLNRTQMEKIGYTFEEVIGQPIWKFVVGEEASRQRVLSRLSGAMPTGQNIEVTLRRKDGTTYPVLVQERALRDADGRITAIRSTIQDITDRKCAEEEKAALQEQFRQSQKMEAIGKLAGGIAHDFNNLLTVIKGYSQLSLFELPEDAPLWGNINEIQKAADRAADLTRQLLAFSRRQILEMKVLDLNTLLKDLDKMLFRIIGEDVEMVTHPGSDLGRVKADPGQIEQVVVNLAVNARDAMRSGGKLIIETANVELDEAYARTHIPVTPGRYVMLAVSDTGEGMTSEVRERIFEPFFTTKEKGKGTGLGLSTVYGIVKQSGGYIWVYSEPGKGTTFKVYLPRVDEELEELKERTGGKELLHRGETILVVEDNNEVRKLAVRILEKQGYRILVASTGMDALSVSKEHKEPIHLLLTDVVMPGMSGRELMESLTSLRPETKVLFMSGYTDNAIAHQGVLEEGMNYIQKPFTVDGLTRKVQEVLDR